MKLGIIGSGNIGGTLGKRWAAHGHQICFGVRDPQDARIRTLLSEAPGAQAASIAEAVAFGEVVLLAVPGTVGPDTVAQISDWGGKILIDATNGMPRQHASLSEDVAAAATGARVVKAFNSVGWEILANPQFGGQSADMFICGDDREAKAVVSQLIQDMGMVARDAGALANARLIDSLAFLWMQLAGRGGEMGRGIAFKLLTR